jgi:Ca-activated chloride channel family protein
MRLRPQFAFGILLLLTFCAAWGQQSATPAMAPPPAQPSNQPDAPVTTLRLQARLVDVATVVRDKSGQPVGGLAKDDFLLRQDGQPQEIRYFSQGSDLPLTLTLMVDTSGSQRMFIADETAASMVFFRAMLTQPDDRASLVQFDDNVLELQPMTNSVDNLQRALDYLSYPHRSLLPGNHGGTLLYDAIVSASARVLAGEHGRKAMVLLTDGGDNGSRRTLTEAVAAAQRADIVVYSVYYSDERNGAAGRMAASGGSHLTSQGRDALEQMSSETGGKVFDVDQGMTLRQIFAQIAENLRLQYELGYRPPDAPPGSYHKIELKMTDHKLKVQARKGFYTP